MEDKKGGQSKKWKQTQKWWWPQIEQAQLEVPHSEIQVELDWQLNWQDVSELGGGDIRIPDEDIWSDV